MYNDVQYIAKLISFNIIAPKSTSIHIADVKGKTALPSTVETTKFLCTQKGKFNNIIKTCKIK